MMPYFEEAVLLSVSRGYLEVELGRQVVGRPVVVRFDARHLEVESNEVGLMRGALLPSASD